MVDLDRYGPEYRALAEEVRRTAPGKVCRRCGIVIKVGDEVEAGHIVDLAIDPFSKDLAPEHKRCNRSAGSVLGKRKHKFKPSRAW